MTYPYSTNYGPASIFADAQGLRVVFTRPAASLGWPVGQTREVEYAGPLTGASFALLVRRGSEGYRGVGREVTQ